MISPLGSLMFVVNIYWAVFWQLLGGGDGELKKGGGKKKFITREEEPQQ